MIKTRFVKGKLVMNNDNGKERKETNSIKRSEHGIFKFFLIPSVC